MITCKGINCSKSYSLVKIKIIKIGENSSILNN